MSVCTHVYTYVWCVHRCVGYVSIVHVCARIPAVLFPTRVRKSGRKYAPKSGPVEPLESGSERGRRRRRSRAHRGQGLGSTVLEAGRWSWGHQKLEQRRRCPKPQAAPQPHSKTNNQAFPSPENLPQKRAAKGSFLLPGSVGRTSTSGNLPGVWEEDPRTGCDTQEK